MTPYAEGYYAGLTDDRDNPHPMWDLAWLSWRMGNAIGVQVHCALVEAVYLKSMEH